MIALLPASASAVHNTHMGVAQLINGPGSQLGTSFTVSHDNIGDPQYHSGEPTQCNAAGTQYFGNSVWYRFHPHRNGRLRVVAQATSGTLEPVVAVIAYTGAGTSPGDITSGVCNGSTPPINRATLPAEGFLVAPQFPISAGQGYLIQVGGATENNQPPFEETEDPMNFDFATEGTFDLAMTYDPDTDGDGRFDSEDRCPNEGAPAHAGCPDSDGDNIPNIDDRCPTLNAGAAGGNYGGCPDGDGDGVPEGAGDNCPGLNPARVNRNDKRPRDGCPDILQINAGVSHGFSGSDSRGLTVSEWAVTNVIKGARVEVRCKLPGGRSCGKLTVKRATATAVVKGRAAARKIKVRSLTGRKLPYGTVITIRVTARYAAGRVIKSTLVRPPKLVVDKKFCMKPGSRKLRKRGCV